MSKVCNTFEEMMQDKGARRKVYEVKRRKKNVIEKVETDSKVRKNLEMWMINEKDEKIQSQKTKVVRERKMSEKIESKECEKGAKSGTWSSQSKTIKRDSKLLKDGKVTGQKTLDRHRRQVECKSDKKITGNFENKNQEFKNSNVVQKERKLGEKVKIWNEFFLHYI